MAGDCCPLLDKFENNYLRVCATVLVDLYSRPVVGWAMSERIDQQLVLDALNMALGQCRPQAGLIHHTDQWRQYSSTAYIEILKKNGMVQSMSRRGNCYDNAVAESFFS